MLNTLLPKVFGQTVEDLFKFLNVVRHVPVAPLTIMRQINKSVYFQISLQTAHYLIYWWARIISQQWGLSET